MIYRKKNKRNVLERRRTVLEKIFFAIWFVVLAVWSAILLYMFFWALTNAFKSNIDYIRTPLSLPKFSELRWVNFLDAIDRLEHNGVGFFGMVFNSIWYVLGGVLLNVFSNCVVGYVLGQYDFKGRNFILSLIIFIMILPIYGSGAATYKLVFDLGINDSVWYLLPTISGISGTALICYGYFRGIPKAYREAVYVDGGSDFTAFFHVGMPMGKSIFMAYFLLGFISRWNNYADPILYLDSMPTLASGLYYFQQEIVYAANEPAYFAGALITMVPVLLLFIFFADQIFGKMYMGGLKG